jgi:nucleolin
VQRRFASAEAAEKSSTLSYTADAESSPETEVGSLADSSPTRSAGTPVSSTEGVATDTIIGEETPASDSSEGQPSGSSSQSSASQIEAATMRQDFSQDSATAESAPINETLASAAAAAGAADAVAASSKAHIPAARQQRNNFNNASPNTTLYVGNLYFEVSEDALQRQFTQFGNILKTRLVYDHRGLSKGSVPA